MYGRAFLIDFYLAIAIFFGGGGLACGLRGV